jgi:tetratricopeptide (TPR) repeat protein
MSDNEKINELYSNGMYEFINQNYDRSIEILSQVAELDRRRKLTFVSRGSAYLRLDRLEEALDDFNRAIELDSKYARAYHLRGLVLERQGDDSSAIEDFTQAIELNPEYGAAYHSRATLHAKTGNEDLAVDDMAMVQHLTNKNIEAFANDNNVWRSQQMRVENALETELER